MPSNTNHVCFHCRTAVRRAKTHGQAVLCPECGRTCTRLSYKLAIPPKHQPKAWQALQNKIQAYHTGQAAYADQMQQRNKAELQQHIAQLWQSLTTRLAADAQRPDSATARRLNSLLTYLLQQHAATPQQLHRLNVRLALLARSLVRRHRHAAAEFIADKVKSWDSRQMSDKLELSIGRDLQFIRINGTLVGGLVGLLIYTLSQWLPAL